MSRNTEMIITLSSIVNQVLKRVDQSLSLHGMSFSEFLVMYHLSQSPKKRMRRIDLADRVGLSASGVTRLLNPMEKIHIVEKEINPRDARVSLVALTDAGEALFQNAMATLEENSASVFNPLSDKKIASLVSIAKDISIR